MKRILDMARQVINKGKRRQTGRQMISLDAYEEGIDHVDTIPAEAVKQCITFNQECVVELVFDFMDSDDWGADHSKELMAEIRYYAVQRRDLFTRKEELEEVQENV